MQFLLHNKWANIFYVHDTNYCNRHFRSRSPLCVYKHITGLQCKRPKRQPTSDAATVAYDLLGERNVRWGGKKQSET